MLSATSVIPDDPSTIAAQIAQLRAGERRVVMVPTGGVQPESSGLAKVTTGEGTFYYAPKLISARAIKRAAAQGKLNEVLGPADGGMGPQSKADVLASGKPPVAIVAKDRKGTPVQETLATPDAVARTVQQAAKVTPQGGSIATTTPQEVIEQREQRLASHGVDLNRGSSTMVGLSQRGERHAADLGDRVAAKGGVDDITTSDAARAIETTAAIQNSNPKRASVKVDPNLESWRQGALEGQPMDQVKGEIHRLMGQNPDEPAPGQGALTEGPGESYNDFTRRLLSTVGQKLAEVAQDPSRIRMLVTHSQGAKAIRAWVNAGTPENFEVGHQAAKIKTPAEPPAAVERIYANPKTARLAIERVDMNSDEPFQPGSLYIARHAETPISKENYEPAAGSPSPAERMMHGYFDQDRPQAATGRLRAMRKITGAVRSGNYPEAIGAAQDGMDRRALTVSDANRAVTRSRVSPLESDYRSLSIPRAISVGQVASDRERETMVPILARKLEAEFQRLPGAERSRVMAVIHSRMMQQS